MFNLAYKIRAPSFYQTGSAGMQMQGDRSGWGVTQSVMTDTLKWEASEHGARGAWSTYYYVTVYKSGVSEATFRQDIMTDIGRDSAPVVVMVDAGYLPNWTNGGGVPHFITVLGYDNPSHKYAYTDTCANLTGCGSNYNGGVQ